MATFRQKRARERLVHALDQPDLESAERWLDLLAEEVGVFKVGLELFTAAGPAAVEAVHRRGAACFLDLKVHDIPATVGRTTAAAVALGVRYLTVHAAAGPSALEAAVRAAVGTPTQLLAITVLTSIDSAELGAIGLGNDTATVATRLARMAAQQGVRGFVCSSRECALLKKAVGPTAHLVVPGVRPAGSARGDQRRVATPTDAMRGGADLLVVGRPIRDASDPVAAARAIVREIADVTGEAP